MGRGGFGLKGRFRWSRVSCLIRVTSWIVSFVRKTKDDPRSHTNRHEAKHSCLELVPTFEAKLPSRDILAPHERANGHALSADGFVAADFLSGPGDPLLACGRNG